MEPASDEPDCEPDPAWEEEIVRRLEKLDSGEVASVPWPEARQRIMGEQAAPEDN